MSSVKGCLEARIYLGDSVEVVGIMSDKEALRASLIVQLEQESPWTQGEIVNLSTDEVVYRARKASEE